MEASINKKDKVIFINTTSKWNLQNLKIFLSGYIIDKISVISIPTSNIEDRIAWKFYTHGELTVKSAIRANNNSLNSHPRAKFLNSIWRLILLLISSYLLGSLFEIFFLLGTNLDIQEWTLTEIILSIANKKILLIIFSLKNDLAIKDWSTVNSYCPTLILRIQRLFIGWSIFGLIRTIQNCFVIFRKNISKYYVLYGIIEIMLSLIIISVIRLPVEVIE